MIDDSFAREKERRMDHLPKCEVRRRTALYQASNTPCTLRLWCLDLCHVQQSANRAFIFTKIFEAQVGNVRTQLAYHSGQQTSNGDEGVHLCSNLILGTRSIGFL